MSGGLKGILSSTSLLGKKNLLGKTAKLFNARPSHGCFRLKTTFRPAVSHNHRPKIDGWISIIKLYKSVFLLFVTLMLSHTLVFFFSK